MDRDQCSEAARVFAEFTADFEGESSAAGAGGSSSGRPGGGFVRAGSASFCSSSGLIPSWLAIDCC
jgi:hypothetical protein